MSDPTAPVAPLTITSTFDYTAPEVHDDSAEFEANLREQTKAIEDEFNAQKQKEDYGEPEPESEVEPEASPAEPVAKASDDDPGVTRGLDRLVAREVALSAREAALVAAEAKVTALQTEMAQYKGLKSTKDLASQITHSPSEVVKSLGGDPATVVKLMLAEQLGDKAPADLQEFARNHNRDVGTNQRIAQLEAQLAESSRAQSEAAYFNAINLGAKEYVKTVGADMPTLSAIAKANPDHAHGEIMEEIARDARERIARDPGGEPLTYEAAARAVETRLGRYKSMFEAPNSTSTTTQSKSVSRTQPPQPKPATKPLAPWARNEASLEEQGLRDAMRTFHVEEAKRTATRK